MAKTKDNKHRQQNSFILEPLIEIMAKLRSPGGCVWDNEQTHTKVCGGIW